MRSFFRFLAPFVLSALIAAGSSATAAHPNNVTVFEDAKFYLNVYGVFEDTVYVYGTSGIGWSNPYDVGGYLQMDTEILSLDLIGGVGSAGLDVRVKLNGDFSSTGLASGQSPGMLFPADSFFDIYFEVELPGLLPGDTLHNETPLNIDAEIGQMPPYFSSFTGQPAPALPLYDRLGAVAGEITFWLENAVPYSPPEAFVYVPVSPNSIVAVSRNDTITVRAGLTGTLQPLSAAFAYRQAGTGDPFTDFWIDFDGAAPAASTYWPMGGGDGWAGYLDVSGFSPAGGYYEFEVCFGLPEGDVLCDTTVTYIDATPPIPEITSIPRDSIGFFWGDSLHEIEFETLDESSTSGVLEIFPATAGRSRGLESVDQHRLGPDANLNDMSCGPASAASCLTYWADNGYPELKHPGGELTRPEQTGHEIGHQLQQMMGTSTSGGTTDRQMTSGIQQYLEEHGMSGWSVGYGEIDGYGDMDKIENEFTANGEDVIILLEDSLSGGGALGHWVTLGGVGSTYYCVPWGDGFVGGITFRVNFMDPGGGVRREHNVGEDGRGRPVLQGFRLYGGEHDARIAAYIKVSPPEDLGGGDRAMRGAPARAPGGGGWIPVDSGPVTGFGQPDTLLWDTTGFSGGVYLLRITMLDLYGNVCTDMRLCGIPNFIAGDEEPDTPESAARLIGSYPNPFNPATTIRYSLAVDSDVSIRIYDVAGGLVRILLSEKPTGAGIHEVRWDGRSDGGRAMASGVYFCRLETRDGISGIKIVLLR